MTDSYPIRIWSGLLFDGHVQRIEGALWEFLWLINKVTKEEKGIGMVLKGRPIKIQNIADDLQRDERSVRRHLKLLETEGYINLKKCPYGLVITINNSKKFANRPAIIGQSRPAIIGQSEKASSDNSVQQTGQICPESSAKNVRSKEDIKHIYKSDIKEDIYCRDEKIPFSEIVDYLNLKAEKNYRSNIAKTHDLIRARFNTGFDLKDFKKVIDIKTLQWKDDPAMNKFLRPETLFGNKFEGYLNEKVMAEMRSDGRAKKHFENERTYTDEEQQRIDAKFFGKKD